MAGDVRDAVDGQADPCRSSNEANVENGVDIGSAPKYTTPKLGTIQDGRFDADDGSNDIAQQLDTAHLATPTLANPHPQESPNTIKPELEVQDRDSGISRSQRPANLRLRTISARSLQLHELAKLHDPEPSSSLTVGDGEHLTHLSLSTPTLESFTADNLNPLGEAWGGASPRRRGVRRGDSDTTATPTKQRRSKSAQGMRRGHRATSSMSSASSVPPSPDAHPKRHSAYFASSERPAEFQFGNGFHHTSEPGDLAGTSVRPTRSESVSSSASSVAESAGTAAEATDSEYEQERVKSQSRASSRPMSRRPSYTPSEAGSAGTGMGSVGGPSLKRLSSFAPIPALNFDGGSASMPASKASSPNEEAPKQDKGKQKETLESEVTQTTSNGQSEHVAPTMEASPSTHSTTSTQSSQASDADASSPEMSRSSSHTGTATATAAESLSAMILNQPGSGVGTTKNPRLPKSKRGSQKPTALEKVMSKTRQRDLPPKEEKEDTRHLKEFHDMLAFSKQAQAKKKQQREKERAAKENLASSHFHIWEKQILPNWKQVLRDDGKQTSKGASASGSASSSSSASLKDVWWSGTMPPRYRARLWQGCIGNGLALGKASYPKALAIAEALRKAGKFPQDVEGAIQADIARTLPQTRLFQKQCPLHDDLVSVILANSTFWQSSSPTYSKGTSYLAAMLLVSMPPQDAFLSLVNLINKSLLKTFYRGPKDDIDAYYRVFNTLLADKMPKIYRNFVSHDIRPHLYLTPWLTTLYSGFLGFETTTRIWDVYVLEGDQFLYRLALAILQILEARLFNPDHEELAELFRGEDKGAKLIVARETAKADDSLVEPWEVYELLGATEDTVFDTIRSMEWKEATFHRLLTRELPDADA